MENNYGSFGWITNSKVTHIGSKTDRSRMYGKIKKILGDGDVKEKGARNKIVFGNRYYYFGCYTENTHNAYSIYFSTEMLKKINNGAEVYFVICIHNKQMNQGTLTIVNAEKIAEKMKDKIDKNYYITMSKNAVLEIVDIEKDERFSNEEELKSLLNNHIN